MRITKDRIFKHTASIHDYPSDAKPISASEQSRERFPFTYLPENVRAEFSEAMDCYYADLHNAFASMCRRTAAVSAASLNDQEFRKWHMAYDDIVNITEIDITTVKTLRTVLFDPDARMPRIDPGQSAVLLEIMKDVLFQNHIRAAKFRAAMKMRRFFAEEQRNSKTLDK